MLKCRFKASIPKFLQSHITKRPTCKQTSASKGTSPSASASAITSTSRHKQASNKQASLPGTNQGPSQKAIFPTQQSKMATKMSASRIQLRRKLASKQASRQANCNETNGSIYQYKWVLCQDRPSNTAQFVNAKEIIINCSSAQSAEAVATCSFEDFVNCVKVSSSLGLVLICIFG